jgi:hypothetical protein
MGMLKKPRVDISEEDDVCCTISDISDKGFNLTIEEVDDGSNYDVDRAACNDTDSPQDG